MKKANSATQRFYAFVPGLACAEVSGSYHGKAPLFTKLGDGHGQWDKPRTQPRSGGI